MEPPCPALLNVPGTSLAMETYTQIYCPNCGSLAHRLLSDRLPQCHNCPDQRITKTECLVCDYLLITCQINGKVLEAYSPSRSPRSSPVSPARSTAVVPDRVSPGPLPSVPRSGRTARPTLPLV